MPSFVYFGIKFPRRPSAPFYERVEDAWALTEIAWKGDDVAQMVWLLSQIRQEGNHPRLEPLRVYLVLKVQGHFRSRKKNAYLHVLANARCRPVMESPAYILKDGTAVITHDRLDSTQGLMVNPLHLGARKAGTKGIIRGVVGGHGGDVYWVGHDQGQPLAAYGFTEFELDGPVEQPKTAYDAIGADE